MVVNPGSRSSVSRAFVIVAVGVVILTIFFWSPRVGIAEKDPMRAQSASSASPVATGSPTVAEGRTESVGKMLPNSASPLRTGCGVIGAEKLSTLADVTAWQQSLSKATVDLRTRMQMNLMSSADAETKAAGLLLAADWGFSTEVQGCDLDNCRSEIKARNEEVVKRYVSPLAEMAVGTKSGEVYGLALSACDLARTNSETSPFCDSLTHLRWAQIAPDNVWPWLALASESQRHSDVSGTEFAMNHATAASDWRTEMHSVETHFSDNLPAGASGLPLLGIMASTVRLDAAAQAAGLNVISRYCPQQQDGNLHQTCVKLSHNLLSKSDSILGLSVGISIAERTGLPAEALAPLRAERDDATSKFKDLGMATLNDPLAGCPGIEKALKYFGLAAKVGERSALR